MRDATVILSELRNLSIRTTATLIYNERLLGNLTVTALGPGMKDFDEEKKLGIYTAIGITSMRIVQAKSLIASQKHMIRGMRINEFLAVPLTIIKKVFGINDKEDNMEQGG